MAKQPTPTKNAAEDPKPNYPFDVVQGDQSFDKGIQLEPQLVNLAEEPREIAIVEQESSENSRPAISLEIRKN